MRPKNVGKRTPPMRLEEAAAEVIVQQQAALRILAEPAAGLSLKAQDNQIARRTNLSPERIRKLRKGYVIARSAELLLLNAIAQRLEARHAEIRARGRALAEALERARAGDGGGGSGGIGD